MRKQLAFIGKDWQSWLEAVLRNWKSLNVCKFPFLDRRHIAILTACRIIKWFHFRPTLASKCIPDFRLVWCCDLVYIPLDFCWNHHNFWSKMFLCTMSLKLTDEKSTTYPPCIGYRTISFLVKIQSPFFCSEMATLDHLGYFMQHLMNRIVISLFKVWKKWISKTGKMRKWSKTANFGHVLVFLSD